MSASAIANVRLKTVHNGNRERTRAAISVMKSKNSKLFSVEENAVRGGMKE